VLLKNGFVRDLVVAPISGVVLKHDGVSTMIKGDLHDGL
jgi:hypothetical protein